MARKLNTGQRGGSMHKEGVHLLRVEEVEEKTSQNSGNDYLNIRYSVLKNGQPFGPSVWDIIVLNEASEWRLNQLFDALDAPENLDIDMSWFKGRQTYARLVIDEYNDEVRNKVKAYLTPAAAAKLLATAGENPEDAALVADANHGERAKSRTRQRTQPSELDAEERMPL